MSQDEALLDMEVEPNVNGIPPPPPPANSGGKNWPEQPNQGQQPSSQQAEQQPPLVLDKQAERGRKPGEGGEWQGARVVGS